MSTIAVKEGVIAYDSRVTSNGVIMDDDFNKMVIVDNVKFFTTGSTPDIHKFTQVYLGKETCKSNDVSAFVIEKDKFYMAGVKDDGSIWKAPLKKGGVYSLGSGADFALAAMDMGASAAEAVLAAIKRDIYSGGNVNKYILQGLV